MTTPGPVAVPLSRIARRKEKTKRTLLQTARQLFSDKGIYWAKVEDITELADIGKGTFYKYFDSKETIIRVLLQQGLEELLVETEMAVRGVPDSRVLAAVIMTRVDFFLRDPDYLLLFHQVRGLMQLQVEAAKDLREVYDAHLRRLAQLLRPVVGAGRTGAARDAATAIAAYTSGVLTYFLLFNGLDAVRQRRDDLVRMLERSVQALLKTGSSSR